MQPAELDEIEARCNAASGGPWKSYVEGRDHVSGSSFIMVGVGDLRGEDMEISREGKPATAAHQDFIASARQDIPRLISEVRRLMGLLGPSA